LSVQLQTPEEAARWLQSRVSGTLCADSRQVGPGDGFIAWPGAATDGRKFVASALAAGASACLVELDGAAAYGFSDERIATYSGLKADTGPIAAAYFNEPSQQLQVAAITGTNGKTSTAWWLAQALGRLGRRCGVVGTLGIGEPGAMVANGLTTPDPVLLQQQLRRLVNEGFRACAIEASSIGLEERRLASTRIDVAVFTNFTQDHLDYHASMPDYWRAKEMLFSWPGLKAAVINIDDARGLALSAALADKSLDLWTFSCTQPARLQARAIVHGAHDLSFDVLEDGHESHRLCTGMVGQYNVSNLLGVIATLRAFGLPLAEAVGACADLLPVPGRTEMMASQGQPLVVIDYAHTPDALEKVLVALRPVALARGGRLRCVFGCGGDRDASKRPLMAAVAEQNADQLIVTSDNPRRENPLSIIAHVLAGLSRPEAAAVQPDRAAAIEQAIGQAQPEDVVLLAGKGHENYQDINGVKLPFSDRAQAQAALDARASLRQSDKTGATAC
jgi:UDP-N-acetylmuramoyl-L-alanyl-D-glutamate--2,6-diaminopimelate ligase